jgi:AcrR family transcriptional regulator
MTRVSEQDQLVTRQRLLEAAGEVFADKGFRGATIRDICRRADANVAAVKYHFGDKETLYAAALRYAHTCAAGDIVALTTALAADATPRQRLLVFIRAMLAGVLDPGKPAWHGKLVAREMAEPTKVLQQIAEEGVKPRVKLLSEIVRCVLGADAPDDLVHRCVRSVVGQILFYHFARPMLVRVFPNDAMDVDTLAEHIATFSLGGLREVARERGRESGAQP